MNTKSLFDSLQDYTRMKQYSHKIDLEQKFLPIPQGYSSRFQFTIKSSIQIPPPSLWLNVSQQASQKIQHNINKSRKNKDAFLKSYSRTLLLNEITYDPFPFQDGIGSIQESEKCLCVGLSVIKEDFTSCLNNIGRQLRNCVRKKNVVIDLSQNARKSQLDEISQLLNKYYRIFLLFQAKSHPIFHQICYYPHVQFTLKQLKLKEKKIVTSELFMKMEKKQLQQDYGFLAFDQKVRYLFIDKLDPNFSGGIIGMWVYGSFPSARTKKQLGKDECFWAVMMEFYKSEAIKNRVSVIGKNSGILCFIDKNSSQINPIIYSFEIKKTDKQKWTFLTKSQPFQKLEQIKEIKMDLSNLPIIEEKQYSEISQNFSKQELNRNENINRQNTEIQLQDMTKSQIGSEMNKTNRSYDERDLQIKFLKKQLQLYKNRCQHLEKMLNPIYFQSMMFNNPYQQNPYQQPMPPPYFQQPQVFQNPYIGEQLPNTKGDFYPSSNINEEKQQAKVEYCFREEPAEEVTFSIKETSPTKLFLKKQSFPQNDKEEEIEKKQYSHDYRNISFQDSFAQEEENFQDDCEKLKKIKSAEDNPISQRSPEFKRIVSLEEKHSESVEKEQEMAPSKEEPEKNEMKKDEARQEQEEKENKKKSFKVLDSDSESSDEEEKKFKGTKTLEKKKLEITTKFKRQESFQKDQSDSDQDENVARWRKKYQGKR